MLRRQTFWVWGAVIFQLLTAVIHSLSFFSSPVITNETEKQLIELMSTYRKDLGGGFQPTMMDLLNALSSCLALLYLFGALINIYIVRKRMPAQILKGVILINLPVFGICFAVMAFLTFLPPIVLTGLTFLFLMISYFSIRPGGEAP